MKPQNIIIVDDHPVITHSIGLVLSGEGFEVQSAWDAHALRSHLRDKQPADLVILDVGLPDADGIKLVSEIRDAHDVPVLVFSGSSDEKTIRACERNGAVGFVAKHDKPHALLIAVAKVLAGERCFPQYYLEWVKTACDDTVQLNQSQERVLRLLIAGHRNKDIAEQLHLSVGSVKNIVTALLQSFQVDSRQRLILAALAAGYKPDPRTATSNTLN